MSVLSTPEVMLAILASLPASKHDDTSVLTLIARTKASHVLREVAQTDSLWIKHYRARWTRARVIDTNDVAWYLLYCTQRTAEIKMCSLLDVIITTPSQRGDAASTLCGNYKGLSWDVMRNETECRVPEAVSDVFEANEETSVREQSGFGEEWVDGTGKWKTGNEREDRLDMREVRPDWIQRRWWAKQALGTLTRLDAMLDMIRVFYPTESNSRSIENARNFEKGMIALSGLMGVDTHEIGHIFDRLAQACKNSLIQGGIEVDATGSEFDLKRFSKGVCDWMRSQGFRRTQGDQPYDDLMSGFPHAFTTTNRSSVPMSLVCTFVAITTRLGLLAGPVGILGHVHAWIGLPSDQQSESSSSSGTEEIDWEDEQPLRSLRWTRG
ncbi:F-box only protein 21 [Ceratobasidium sp. AG-Ba]|nr:F-box only protein 21 [Ceratobasidium sp. AG-Ba]